MGLVLEYKTKYAELKEILIRDVIEPLKPDDQMPTEVALMHEYRLSYSTVSRAMKELESEGYIYRIRGKGSFKADSGSKRSMGIKSIERLESLQKETIDIGVAFFSIADKTDFIMEILKGVGDSCETLGFETHMYATRGKFIVKDKDSLLKFLILSRQIDGLILLSPFDEKDVFSLHSQGIPFVVVNYGYTNLKNIVRVMSDCYEMTRLSLEYLSSNGHKSLGIIEGPHGRHNGSIWLGDDPVRGLLRELAPQYGVKLKFVKSGSYFDGDKMMDQVLKRPPLPSAIITDGDILYEGVLKSLHSHNLIPGKDVFILNYADSSRPTGQPVIQRPLFEMGKAAVDLLAEMIAGRHEDVPKEVCLKPTLVLP